MSSPGVDLSHSEEAWSYGRVEALSSSHGNELGELIWANDSNPLNTYRIASCCLLAALSMHCYTTEWGDWGLHISASLEKRKLDGCMDDSPKRWKQKKRIILMEYCYKFGLLQINLSQSIFLLLLYISWHTLCFRTTMSVLQLLTVTMLLHYYITILVHFWYAHWPSTELKSCT